MAEEIEQNIPFRDALKFWIKLGFISFGGPAGQIAIMHKELVERRKWISEESFLHALISACCCRGRRLSSLRRITAGGFTGSRAVSRPEHFS